MGNRSKQNQRPGKIRRRADRDHAAKKRAKVQKAHLRLIKNDEELRQIVLASRFRQRRRS